MCVAARGFVEKKGPRFVFLILVLWVHLLIFKPEAEADDRSLLNQVHHVFVHAHITWPREQADII